MAEEKFQVSIGFLDSVEPYLYYVFSRCTNVLIIKFNLQIKKNKRLTIIIDNKTNNYSKYTTKKLPVLLPLQFQAIIK